MSTDSPRQTNPFIPAWLDDAGLTAHQFRIFCRIARRGVCHESLKNMAKGCHMKRQTAQDALAALVEINAVVKEKRFGRTSIYTLAPDPKGVLGPTSGTRPERGTNTRPERGTRDLTRKGYYKGIPPKGIQGRESKASSPPPVVAAGGKGVCQW